MSLGKNILTLRKKSGLSQEQLGEKVNVTRQTISNWELDETAPNPEQLKLLSKALQVSIDILVDNDIVANNSNKTIYNIAKFIGIIFLILLVIDIITFIIFMF
ncbi:MAG: helix-turn-helix transcriptional regulator [Bacilli bacterium]|nr:helix-turn-helix transcriptional regulator [Bacilli bacterium]